MVGAGDSRLGQDLAGKLPEAPLHSVADNRSAYFPGNGQSEANGGIAILSRTHEQHEARSWRAATAVCGEKVRPAADFSDGPGA